MFPSKQTSLGLLFLLSSGTVARNWHDTGGGIILEEAWTIPDLLFQVGNTTAAFGGTNAELKANLLDIHNQRLALMNANDIDFMVLSCTQPCIQGFSDPVAAAAMAVTVNNDLASSIANNTERFGGFAALSMHNATEAALELQRSVTELGFLGALLNDYQQSGSDGNTLLYYDQPEYDVFWQMVSDLDVPVYFHPRTNIPEIITFEYQHARFLLGPAQEFTALSTHILGLCTNGVFDRFPNLKIIVGHLGERIPSDLNRIDTQLLRQVINGMPMKKNVTTYFHTNIFETTSGNFATELLKFHINQIGLDRIMYSIDYPFVAIPDGATWINTLTTVLPKPGLESLRRDLAIKVLRLND
ncbi:amidohydrolase 2 [Phlegmacium glaucopus]|nr:amidohydrolase 2 [Phlegmacium glaucopus]